MGISKSFKVAAQPVSWKGEEVATVRGLSPADVAAIVSEHGRDIFMAFNSADAFDFIKDAKNPDGSVDTEAVADRLLAEGPALVAKMMDVAPAMLAGIIAAAADEPEAADSVINWPMPLQFDALVKIAEETFAGPEGFRLFVGNVQALVASVAAMTNAKPKVRAVAPPSSGSGLPTS